MCKAVYHSQYWGKESEIPKAAGAKRDLFWHFVLNPMVFISLGSFVEIGCLSLNLTAKIDIVPNSQLRQAACHFSSLIYIMHFSSPHLITMLWYSKHHHEDFPFPNSSTIFVLPFIRHIRYSHYDSSHPVCHSHFYGAVEINSIFPCIRDFPSICTCND